jgi:hypothetical protein
VQYEIGRAHSSWATRIRAGLRRSMPFAYERLFRDLASLAASEPRFRLVGPLRTFDLLSAADLLVSDWSSTTVEFTALDRPVLFFDSPSLPFADRELHAAFRQACEPFTQLCELQTLAPRALARPNARRTGRRELLSRCVANLGNSGARIAAALAARSRASPGI